MKPLVLAFLAVTLAIGFFEAQSPAKAKVFDTVQIALYNPTDEFSMRAPPTPVLAPYIKRIQKEAAALWEGDKNKDGRVGLIALAIRTDRTMKLWVDVEGEFQPEITASLQKAMAPIGVPQVRHGPIAFAIHFTLRGGSGEKMDPRTLPASWWKAVGSPQEMPRVPDGLLPLVWKKDATGKSKPKMFVPEGFVVQELKPTGGRILMPKGWFYAENPMKGKFMWTLSKEDCRNGSYTTGVRIQWFLEVKKRTGQSPRDYVASIIAEKKANAKVVNERPEWNQGAFKNVGIETIEPLVLDGERKVYRILSSCYWSDEADMFVVSISGTTQELWAKHEGTFRAMADFELCDLKRIEDG